MKNKKCITKKLKIDFVKTNIGMVILSSHEQKEIKGGALNGDSGGPLV